MEVDGNSASAPRPLSAASLPSLPLISAHRTDRKRVRLLSDSNSLSESDMKRMDDEAEADAKAGFYVPRGLSFSRAPPSRDNRSFLPSHAAKMAQSVIPSLLNRTDTAISAASTPSVFQPLQLQGVLAELKSQVVSLEAQNERRLVRFSIFISSTVFSLHSACFSSTQSIKFVLANTSFSTRNHC
jgi:hypothetical protein